MGLHLSDHPQFEDLTVACEHARRWEFLFMAAPLRILGGTGSPIDPLAVL
jgi:kynurenine formamidase